MKAYSLLYIGMAAAMALGVSSCSDDDDNVPASSVPTVVTSTFKEMFPRATGVEWEQNQQYYVADFNVNTFDTEAWYSANGTWAMTVTDYDSMVSMLPLEVSQAFNDSQYSAWIVDDAKYYERPINSFCVIEVETNGFPEIALFYDTMGNLINKVQGDNFYITPTTDPSTIVY